MTMTLIETKTLGTAAASIEFTSIPQDATDLLLVYFSRCVGGGPAGVVLTFNNSTTNFSSRYLRGNGSAASSSTFDRYGGASNGSGDTANTFASNSLYIPNYTGSTNKSYSVDSVTETNGTTAYQQIIAGLWANTAAITSLKFENDAGLNLEVGTTASLYKILKGTDGIVVVS